MRAVPILLCSVLLSSALSACAVHEDVKSSYVGTASMDQSQVMQLLNQNGYQEVTNLHKNGPNWVGSAAKDGAAVTFDIDKDGKIHTK
jgi:hypothetical protein